MATHQNNNNNNNNEVNDVVAVQPSSELDYLDKMAEQHAKMSPMISEVNKLVVSLLPPLPRDAHILDFGCGAGRISLMLGQLDNVSSVVGIDISKGMIDQAKQLLKEEPNPKVSFEVSSERLPTTTTTNFLEDATTSMKEASKDLVVMSLVLGHIHPKEAGEAVVAKVATCLKRGGKFALAEFVFVADNDNDETNKGDDGPGYHHHHHHHHHDHSHSHEHENSHSHTCHGHPHKEHDEDHHKSHHGGHVAYTEEEIRQLFAKSGLEPVGPKFIPFEFEWGGISRKCIMAIGIKV